MPAQTDAGEADPAANRAGKTSIHRCISGIQSLLMALLYAKPHALIALSLTLLCSFITFKAPAPAVMGM